MTKKKKIIIGAVLLAVVCAVLFAVGRSPADYTAFSVTGCEASAYEEENGIGYLTFTRAPGLAVNRVKVESPEIMAQLSDAELNTVIGINLDFVLPGKTIVEKNMNTERLDPLNLLDVSDEYEDYFTVTEVFFDA